MGCGNSKTIEDTERSKIGNQDKDSNKTYSNSKHQTLTTEENEKRNITKEQKQYVKFAEDAKYLKKVEWVDLILEQETYFDILNQLNYNTNLEQFLFGNTTILGKL